MRLIIPSWWQLALLGLAVARTTRLLGWDDLTIPFRTWLTGLGDEQHKQFAYSIDHQKEVGDSAWQNDDLRVVSARLADATGNDGVPPLVIQLGPVPPVSERRYYLSKLVRCPWCAGWWISVATWLLWLLFPHATLVASTPLALSELVGLVSKNLDEH